MNGDMGEELRIRGLTTLAEFDRCVELQVAVWGYSDGDVIPRRMFLLAGRIGGQVIGAFDGETMVGFAMAIPGYRDGQAYLHSHMLAVLPEYRNQGLGRRLKLAQRNEALERGFDLMEWTFDPLEIKNAHLNLARLGAVCRRYQADFYGPSTSPLQGGLPTDRLYAEWWLRSDRVNLLLERSSAGRNATQPDDVRMRVTVPAEIYAWKLDPAQRDRALLAQTTVREALEDGFRAGLVATGYARDAEGNGSYLLEPWIDPGLDASRL